MDQYKSALDSLAEEAAAKHDGKHQQASMLATQASASIEQAFGKHPDMLAETFASMKQASASMKEILAEQPEQASELRLMLADDTASMKQASASIGGRVRAERLSPERRKEIGQAAAKARWAKSKKHTPGFIIMDRD